MRRRAVPTIVVLLLWGLLLLGAVLLIGRFVGPATPAVPGDAGQLDGGWFDVHFTAPLYPDDRTQHRGGIDKRLVALIDRAERSVDVAVYDFDLENVARALARARQRGVRVRMVTDTDTLSNQKNQAIQEAIAILRGAEIPIVGDGRQAIMHHKFTVVDDEWVATGSWNFTDGDTYRLNNWLGIVRSRDLAANFIVEFEEMFVRRTFGPTKQTRVPHPDTVVAGRRVRTCFAPPGECGDLIVETIRREATSSIHFLAFSFTHDGIGRVMLEKAKAGVRVSGVFETTGSQTRFSEFGAMKQAGLNVYTDGNPYVMHHKVIVVDERVVIAGSFNFSAGADEANDETVLVVEDPALAQRFLAEFERVLAVAKNPPTR